MANVNLNFYQKFDKTKKLRSRIELHLHLEGSFRLETIWDLAKKKGIDLGGAQSVKGLRDLIQAKRPGTLATFLEPFEIFLPVFRGDGEAVERAAYELCEDQAKQGVLYFETRFCPHLLSNTHIDPKVPLEDPSVFTPKMVTEHVLKGLKRGEADFQIKARAILCCLRFTTEWNYEVLELCKEFKGKGVVAIDIAGDEAEDGNYPKEVMEANAKIFQEAEKLQIRRTVHAAEAGCANNVRQAIQDLKAERIGHGYRVLPDPEIYRDLLSSGIHIECCPFSSILTGSVALTCAKHPIIRFAEDNANFSISKDDPLITGKWLDDEYQLLLSMGLSEAHLAKANFNAARSCFLPEEEKKELLAQLSKNYGFII